MDAPESPKQLLESERIQWNRDFDAVAVGFALGSLATLALTGLGLGNVAAVVMLVAMLAVGLVLAYRMGD